MKGLLKNNFLSVCPDVKAFSAFLLLLGAVLAAFVGPSLFIGYLLLIGYTLLCMVGFSVLFIGSLKKEAASRWGRYKLTLPVKRADIVKSYFISQLIWLAAGMAFAGAGISLTWLLHGCPFDKSIDTLSVFALGASISLFTGAFFFPSFYLCGEDRGGAALLGSLLCGIGASAGIIGALNYYLTPGITAILLGDVVLTLCSLSAFALSYPLTVRIYAGKEY